MKEKTVASRASLGASSDVVKFKDRAALGETQSTKATFLFSDWGVSCNRMKARENIGASHSVAGVML